MSAAPRPFARPATAAAGFDYERGTQGQRSASAGSAWPNDTAAGFSQPRQWAHRGTASPSPAHPTTGPSSYGAGLFALSGQITNCTFAGNLAGRWNGSALAGLSTKAAGATHCNVDTGMAGKRTEAAFTTSGILPPRGLPIVKVSRSGTHAAPGQSPSPTHVRPLFGPPLQALPSGNEMLKKLLAIATPLVPGTRLSPSSCPGTSANATSVSNVQFAAQP